jgi:hypothetical protein
VSEHHQQPGARTDHVLDLIDRTLDDGLSDDAMRVVPDEADVPDCGHTECMGAERCRHTRRPVQVAPAGTSPTDRGWRNIGWVDEAAAFTADDATPGNCGHARCVGADTCRWAAYVAQVYGVPLDAVSPLPGPPVTPGMDRVRVSWPQSGGLVDVREAAWVDTDRLPDPRRLPRPLAQFWLDGEGNLRTQHGLIVVDRAAAQRAVADMVTITRKFAQAMRPVVDAYGRAARQLADAITPAARRITDTDPDETVMQRALRLRRNRNTGPARDPHRHRGM